MLYIDSMSIGERLKWAREKIKKSQGQVKIETGVDVTYLSKLEGDKQLPSTWVLLRDLAAYYRVSADFILGLTEDPTPASKKELPESLRELWEVYEDLPRHRRWDMLKIAAAFAEEDERAELSRELDEQIRQRLDVAEQAGGEAASELLADLVPRLSAMIMERRAAGRSVVGGGVESKRVDEKIEDA